MREQKSKTAYATLAEFIAAAKLNPNPPTLSRSFAYVETLGEAIELAEKGWEDGTRKIQALSLPIINKVTSLIEVPHIEYDTTGLDFDMGRYIDGAPECWYNFYSTMEQGQGFKHIRVIVNFAVSRGVTARVIESRGAIAAALVLALESTGRRVTLDAVCAVDRGNELWVNLKQADQSLDIDRLAFALVHPAFLRHLLLAVKPWSARVPNDIPAEEQKDIYIGKGHLLETQWANPETASKWIVEQLKTQGVQFNSEEKTYANVLFPQLSSNQQSKSFSDG